MNMGMTKAKEESVWVGYILDVAVDVGLETSVWETKYGYCCLNKETGEFELDRKKSDQYFLRQNCREVVMVHIALKRFRREDEEYPDFYPIATY